MHGYTVYSHCCTVFHGVNMPQFIYLLLTGIWVVSSFCYYYKAINSFAHEQFCSFGEHIYIYIHICWVLTYERNYYWVTCLCSAIVDATKQYS